MVAAMRGNATVINVLLSPETNQEVDVDAITLNRKTALTFAVLGNHREAAAALIKGGANLEYAHELNYTPLMLAIKNNYTGLALDLIHLGADTEVISLLGESPLGLAARHNTNPRIIQRLLQRRTHLNTKDYEGLTPLMLAALHNKTHAVEALLRAGALKKLQDPEGRTALDIARQRRHKTVVGLLSGPTTPKKRAAGKPQQQPSAH